MTRVVHPPSAAGCTLTVLGAVLLLMLAAELQGFGSGGPGKRAPLAFASLGVTGSIDHELYPGLDVPVNVSFTNPGLWPLAVGELSVSVNKVLVATPDAARECTADGFRVTQWSSRLALTVPARSTRTLSDLGVGREQWPTVAMLDLAEDQSGCIGANVMLGFVASGISSW